MSTSSDAPPVARDPDPAAAHPAARRLGHPRHGEGGPPSRCRLDEPLVDLLVAVAASWPGHRHPRRRVLIVIVAIVIMVMVHELGHLLAAKRGGMKVTEYFLGFGPRLWSVRRGETEYGIKAIPAGGYVKILGMTNLEQVDPEDEARAYRNQPFHYRLLVAVAGSAMHFIMAFLLLWGLLVFIGVANNNQTQIAGFTSLTGSANPARAAGVQPGDIVVSVNGKQVGGNVEVLVRAIKASPGRPVSLVVDRGGRRVDLTVTPADGHTVHEAGAPPPTGTAPDGVIGVNLGNPTATTSPIHALGTSTVDLGRVTWQSVLGVCTSSRPARW